MLLTRVLTALALIPLVVWAVLGLPLWGLTLLLAVVVALSAYEWAQFAVSGTSARAIYAAGCGAAVALLPVLASGSGWVFPAAGVLCWVGMSVWIGCYPRGFVTGIGQVGARLTVGAAILLLFAAAALQLAIIEHGRVLILATLVLVWAMDVGGYFFGKQFGRHKLSPQISPNKSWEGFWGGALLALLVAVVAAWVVLPLSTRSAWLFIALGVLVAMVSVLGDLAESMFKRQAGIKDSGSLLPGHGGLLDRLDSTYAAMPLMLAGWLLLDLH